MKEEFNASAPAMTVLKDGTKEWRLDGQLHRANGPAVERLDGSKEWWRNGKLHRTDGPAMECADGRKEWYCHDQRHRIDGPAIERADGSKEWYYYGQRHRFGGPAVITASGADEWWIEGEQLSPEETAVRRRILWLEVANSFDRGLVKPVAALRAARFKNTRPASAKTRHA